MGVVVDPVAGAYVDSKVRRVQKLRYLFLSAALGVERRLNDN